MKGPKLFHLEFFENTHSCVTSVCRKGCKKEPKIYGVFEMWAWQKKSRKDISAKFEVVQIPAKA